MGDYGRLPPSVADDVAFTPAGRVDGAVWQDPDGGAGRAQLRAPTDTVGSRLFDVRQAVDEAFAADNLRVVIVFDKAIGQFSFRAFDQATGRLVREYASSEVIDHLAGLGHRSA